jgi:DNA-binding MarR family transcriptional regulator
VSEDVIKEIVDRYITVSYSVKKRAESLIEGQMSGDLTIDQHYILRYMNLSPSSTSTELAEVFEVKKSAITAIINRMWEKGLIKRTRDEKDRRVVYLTLTDKGKDLFDKTEERIHNLVKSLMNKFDPEEIERFIETYEKLNKVLVESKNDQQEEQP